MTLYRLEEERIISFSEVEGVKKVEQGIRYGPYQMVKPFSFGLVRLVFTFTNPLLVLREARKTITVSHWGSVSVDEYFDMENIGAKVKGELSRIDIGMKKKGKNCLQDISAQYPWYIQGMYVTDFIGNISTTNALRTEETVEFNYGPRYPVCGGWRVDWNQGYSMPTKYNLRRGEADSSQFHLEIDFLYNYDILLAENYTVEIILPYGASDFEIDLPFDIESTQISHSISTLDFFAKPKLVLKTKDVFSYLHSKPLKLSYKFDETTGLLIKPLATASLIFVFLLLTIGAARVKFSFMQN